MINLFCTSSFCRATKMKRHFFHYTNESGHGAITESKIILKADTAVFGAGVYFTTKNPGNFKIEHHYSLCCVHSG